MFFTFELKIIYYVSDQDSLLGNKLFNTIQSYYYYYSEYIISSIILLVLFTAIDLRIWYWLKLFSVT